MISALIMWGGVVFFQAHVTSARRSQSSFLFSEQRWRVVWAWISWF